MFFYLIFSYPRELSCRLEKLHQLPAFPNEKERFALKGTILFPFSDAYFSPRSPVEQHHVIHFTKKLN